MPRTATYDRDVALDAAMNLFWQKGYHATSLKDLEAALHMKPGSIYAAFESKEKLYRLALERYFDMSMVGFRAQQAQAISPLAGMADHFRSYAQMPIEDANRQACMLTKSLVDTTTTDPEIAVTTQAYLDKMADEFAAIFKAAQEAGEITGEIDPERLARRFQANVTALRVELQRAVDPQRVQDLAEDMAQEIENLRG